MIFAIAILLLLFYSVSLCWDRMERLVPFWSLRRAVLCSIPLYSVPRMATALPWASRLLRPASLEGSIPFVLIVPFDLLVSLTMALDYLYGVDVASGLTAFPSRVFCQ